MEEHERRQRPEDVEEEYAGPEADVPFAETRRAKEHCAGDKGADGDKDGGGDSEEVECEGGPGEHGKEVFDFGEVGKRSDVEGEIHGLKQQKQDGDDGGCDARQILGSGEEAATPHGAVFGGTGGK